MTTDGRKARADDGRRRVGDALVELVQEQGRLPDVAAVAARAGVSRRSVFRYFDGVSALELETARVMRERILQELPPPSREGSLDERLSGLLARRATLYEWVTPVRRLLDGVRARGNASVDGFIQEARRLLRAELEGSLAPELARRPELVEALDAVTSWELWSALREGQGLSVADAQREVERLCAALLVGPQG